MSWCPPRILSSSRFHSLMYLEYGNQLWVFPPPQPRVILLVNATYAFQYESPCHAEALSLELQIPFKPESLFWPIQQKDIAQLPHAHRFSYLHMCGHLQRWRTLVRRHSGKTQVCSDTPHEDRRVLAGRIH